MPSHFAAVALPASGRFGKAARIASRFCLNFLRSVPELVWAALMVLAGLEQATRLCMSLGTDGLRAELTLLRAARALAALDGVDAVAVSHLLRVAPSALRHRLRRDPLDDAGSTARVARAVADQFGA